MEKLSFWSSVGKCLQLYFDNFGKIFLPFLWPYLWSLGALIIYFIGFILTIVLTTNHLTIIAMILLLITLVLSFAIYIKALVRYIMLFPATAIVTKKLLFNNEVPDYKTALQEVRDDGWKLAKVILWEIPIALVFMIASMSITFPIFFSMAKNPTMISEKYLALVGVAGIMVIFMALFQLSLIFVSQVFAFRKDLCALDCLIENFRMIGRHFLPVVSVVLIWCIGSFIIGLIPLMGFLLSTAICICIPVFIILPTYWYLRFTEENEEEKGE